MKTRDIVIIIPLLALAVLCYFIGHRQGARSQKITDEMHLIRMSLRNIDDAEAGNTEMIAKRCRTYLVGYIRAYRTLVASNAIPADFKETLAKAERIANETAKSFVPVTKETFEK